MSVSVIAPCFNEIFYVKAWLSNALKFGDEIIVLDTGSTDGSYEWLLEQRFRELKVLRGFETKQRFVWDEETVRNHMLGIASGDVILAYDFDELLGNEFMAALTDFQRSDKLIARFVEYKFWGNMQHLRKRSLRPVIRDGKIGWLSNWRGAYPNKRPHLFRKHSAVKWTGKIHPVLQYKNYGRLTFHLPITKDYGCGVYHYHYAFPPKLGEDRHRDRLDSVPLVTFKGEHPEEVKYFGQL